jgi:hypothetical protein
MKRQWFRCLGATAVIALLLPGRAQAAQWPFGGATLQWPPLHYGGLVKQVGLCKMVHGFIKAPCAGKILGERVLPWLMPLRVSGLRVSQTLIDLDANDLKSKVAGWINEGLDWLGFPDSFRIPKKIGYDLSLAFTLSNLKFAFPRGNEYQPEFGATIAVRVQVLSRGPFQGKTFDVRGTVGGKLYLTVAPYGRECDERKVDWTMIIANLQLTRLDVDRIPDFIDGSDLFLKLVNWGLNKAYHEYPQYRSRGIGICLAGKCPVVKKLPAATGIVVQIGGTSDENRLLTIAFGNDGHPREIRLRDARVFCQVVDAVLTSGCTDAFVNALAKTLLPLAVRLPPHLAGEGLAASVDEFRLGIGAGKKLYLHAAASVSKKDEKERLSVALSAQLELKPRCDAQTFLLLLRPTFTGLSLSAVPRWLTEGIVRAAVNVHLKTFDFCFSNFPVPGLGKSVNACRVTEALLQERCTGPFANAVLDALLPLAVRPEQAALLPAALKSVLQGMRLTVEKARVEIPAGSEREPRVSVEIAISKDGEAQALRTAGTLALGIATRCGAEQNAVRIQPALVSLEVGAIPAWLLRATVLTLANQALGSWQALCAYGPCRSQSGVHLEALLPVMPASTGPACRFDALTGGK